MFWKVIPESIKGSQNALASQNLVIERVNEILGSVKREVMVKGKKVAFTFMYKIV